LPTKKKRTTERCSSVVPPQARSPYLLLKPSSEHVHQSLLPRLSWIWTVLLPNDTHRKLITSIPVVFYFHLWPIYLFCLVTEDGIRNRRIWWWWWKDITVSPSRTNSDIWAQHWGV
jgi:hypothetical protein